MALENYDAIGAWRERQNGEGFKGDDKSPHLDVSGTLPSGRSFSNLTEYKQALLAKGLPKGRPRALLLPVPPLTSTPSQSKHPLIG